MGQTTRSTGSNSPNCFTAQKLGVFLFVFLYYKLKKKEVYGPASQSLVSEWMNITKFILSIQQLPTRTWTPRHGFKCSREECSLLGSKLLSEPLAWRSARLWQISPHSTEARRMVPVSTAHALPSLSPQCVCGCLYCLPATRLTVLNTHSLLLIKELEEN